MGARASEDVGAILRRIVAASGVDPQVVARRAGIEYTDLVEYMAGTALPRTYEPLEHIGNACGVSEYVLEVLADAWYQQSHVPVEGSVLE